MQLAAAEHLDQLIRDESSIYVVNRTKGILVVTFPNGNTTERVVIPKTGHPFNLSSRVPSEAIRGSMEFRRFLTRHVLDLVHPPSAEKILEDPEIKEELQEATERTFTHGKESVATRESVSSSPEAVEALKKMANAMRAKTDSNTSRNEVVAEVDTEDEPNLRAKVILQRVNNGELKVRSALIDLKAIATDLTENDLSYVMSQAPAGLITNWAKKKLDKINAEAEEVS